MKTINRRIHNEGFRSSGISWDGLDDDGHLTCYFDFLPIDVQIAGCGDYEYDRKQIKNILPWSFIRSVGSCLFV